mmetsp:Transcript_22160/g.77667  ORF Transcript_22160/g.77667 Transcript_22160/m.77667 type:complete len:209 (-) Transcript_22160:72-698(-)
MKSETPAKRPIQCSTKSSSESTSPAVSAALVELTSSSLAPGASDAATLASLWKSATQTTMKCAIVATKRHWITAAPPSPMAAEARRRPPAPAYARRRPRRGCARGVRRRGPRWRLLKSTRVRASASARFPLGPARPCPARLRAATRTHAHKHAHTRPAQPRRRARRRRCARRPRRAVRTRRRPWRRPARPLAALAQPTAVRCATLRRV